MKLIDKKVYEEIEKLLVAGKNADKKEVQESLQELNAFFKGTNHYNFLKTYYYERHKYKYRYPRKEDLFKKVYRDLYVEEPTLYQIKKEVIYKAAMIFYKNGVLK